MMKGQDPYAAPPKTGGRRPPRRPGPRGPRDWSFHRGFWLRSLGLTAVVGIASLSIAWASGPERAALIGVAMAALTLGVLVISRLVLLRRSAAR